MKARRTATRNNDVAPEAMNRLLAKRRLAPGDAIDRALVTVNLAESPLAWLARRNMVDPRQFAASERLRHDFIGKFRPGRPHQDFKTAFMSHNDIFKKFNIKIIDILRDFDNRLLGL